MNATELKKLAEVLKGMQQRGLRVDVQAYKELYAQYEPMPSLREKWTKKRGYDPLGRKILGLKSSNQEVLKRLGTPEALEIVKFRQAYSKYQDLTTLGRLMEGDRLPFSYVVAKTGRLYTTGALQTMSKECRKVIIPWEADEFTLYDYMGQELRVIALMTGSKELLHEIENGDIHERTQKVGHKADRKSGKTINYAYIYGMQPEGLKEVFGLSDEDLDELETYLPLQKLREAARSRISEDGTMVQAYFGTWLKFGGEEKELANYMTQGTGAEILKRGAVRLAEAGAQIDMLIHDAYLLENSMPSFKEALEFEIDGIKFPVEVKTGRTWADVTD